MAGIVGKVNMRKAVRLTGDHAGRWGGRPHVQHSLMYLKIRFCFAGHVEIVKENVIENDHLKREIIAVCSEIHTKDTHTLCG
jgi:hypothetical protein